MPKNMSKKTKYTKEDEQLIREYLSAMITGAFCANETQEGAINEIIDEYILPNKRKLLTRALRYKIRTSYVFDFSE